MDWNNDGKTDLIAGDASGSVWLFLNTGTSEQPKLAAATGVEAAGKPLTAQSFKLADVYSKIHMGDWDGDGLKDLLVGHSNTIVFYKNAGTQSAPRFEAPTLVKAPSGGFPVRPSPYVIDWDGDGKNDLLVGSESPEVFFYRNVGTNSRPKLARGQRLELKGSGFTRGYRCRIDVTDWNNDGKRDLLVGTFYSGSGNGGNVWLFLGE